MPWHGCPGPCFACAVSFNIIKARHTGIESVTRLIILAAEVTMKCAWLLAADYEVDFAAVYNKLCGMGAKFDQKKYLYRVSVQKVV